MNRQLRLPDLNYDCLMCGRSCRCSFSIDMDADVAERVEGSDGAAAARKRGYVPLRLIEGRHHLRPDPDGACVLLTDEGLCSIHAQYGFESKPHACKEFPFYPAPSPDGFYMGISFVCRAVQYRSGRTIEEHREFAENLLDSLLERSSYRGFGPVVKILDEHAMTWEDYLSWEEELKKNLRREGVFLQEAFNIFDEPVTNDQLTFVKSTIDMVTASTVALLEADNKPQYTTEIADSLSHGKPYFSQRLDREVPPFACPPVFLDEVYFYLEHVLFRKYLIQGEVIGRLLFLEVKKRLLAYYAWQHAILRGASEPDKEDYFLGLILVERDVLHRSGPHPMFGLLNQAFRLASQQFADPSLISPPPP